MESLLNTNINQKYGSEQRSIQATKRIAANLISGFNPWDVKITSRADSGVFDAVYKDRKITVNSFGVVVEDSLA